MRTVALELDKKVIASWIVLMKEIKANGSERMKILALRNDYHFLKAILYWDTQSIGTPAATKPSSEIGRIDLNLLKLEAYEKSLTPPKQEK